MDEASYKTTSIRLPKLLDRQLRVEAAKQDVSRSELIRVILAQALNSKTVADTSSRQEARYERI